MVEGNYCYRSIEFCRFYVYSADWLTLSPFATTDYRPPRSRTLPPARPSKSAVDQLSRVADAVIAGALLALTLLLMVFVAIAIRLDSPGPILEEAACIGRRGRRFRMLQFRTTMYTPDRRTSINRPELPAVGAFLRYSRIDSL